MLYTLSWTMSRLNGVDRGTVVVVVVVKAALLDQVSQALVPLTSPLFFYITVVVLVIVTVLLRTHEVTVVTGKFLSMVIVATA